MRDDREIDRAILREAKQARAAKEPA